MVKMHDAKLSAIERAAVESLKAAAKGVLAEAKKLAPVEDGKLRKSGKVVVDDTTVAVVFRAPHAWIQHERLDYKHPNGGQAKYLETAANDRAVVAHIIDGVRARLK